MENLAKKLKNYAPIINMEHEEHRSNSEIYQLCMKILDDDKGTLKKCQQAARKIVDKQGAEDIVTFLNKVALYTLAATLELKIK